MTATIVRGPAPTSTTGASVVTGTGTLLRFMLRRDRIRLPAWTFGLAILVAYFAAALDTIARLRRTSKG